MSELSTAFIYEPINCWILAVIFSSFFVFMISCCTRCYVTIGITLITSFLWLVWGMAESSAKYSGANIRFDLIVFPSIVFVISAISIVLILVNIYKFLITKSLSTNKKSRSLIVIALNFSMIFLVWITFYLLVSDEKQKHEMLEKLKRNSLSYPLTKEEQVLALLMKKDYINKLLAKNKSLGSSTSDVLEIEKNPEIRKALAANQSIREPVISKLVGDEDVEVRIALAQNPVISAHNIYLLAKDNDPDVRKALVNRKNIPFAILNEIAELDQNQEIRSLANEKRINHPDVKYLIPDLQSK